MLLASDVISRNVSSKPTLKVLPSALTMLLTSVGWLVPVSCSAVPLEVSYAMMRPSAVPAKNVPDDVRVVAVMDFCGAFLSEHQYHAQLGSDEVTHREGLNGCIASALVEDVKSTRHG